MSRIVNALSFDVEDWFQVENLREAIGRAQWDKLPLRVEASTHRILDLLRPSRTRATFFFLGWVAQRLPDLVRAVAREGHEIASHGYNHELVYRLTPEQFREDVMRSKSLLEDLTGVAVRGYRAPSFSITRDSTWALEVLRDLGFNYDSSVFPITLHDRYGFAECGTTPFRWPNGLLEIPLAVYRLRGFGLPVAGGGYFRLFPYMYFRTLLRRLNQRGEPFTFYAHPWELDPEQPRVDVKLQYRFRHYVNLDKTADRLAELVADFCFDRMAFVYGLDGRDKEAMPTAQNPSQIVTRVQAESLVTEKKIEPLVVKSPRSKMRIAFVIDQIQHELAGTENQLLKLIRGLGTTHEIDLICLRDSEWLQSVGRQLPCSSHVFRIDGIWRPHSIRNIIALRKHFASSRPDVVQTYFPVANIVGVLSARAAGIRSIVASRRDYGEWMTPHYLAATRLANLFVSRIVCNSSQVKRLTQTAEGVAADRIEVIFNGIDPEAFRRDPPDVELKTSLGIPEHSVVVGLVANYRPMKRQATLIFAAGEIIRLRDDIDFLLVGRDATSGELRKATEQLAQTLGIAERVHFVHADGKQKLQELLSLIDIGVNCSEGEGLSNAIMEYMAAGIPCVISDSGGNPDLISDEVNGFTFPLDDYRELARKILRMVEEAETRDRLTRAASEKVRTEMSLDAMVGHFVRLYGELTGSPGGETTAPK